MKSVFGYTGALLTTLALSPAAADDGLPAMPGTLIRVTAPTLTPAPLIGTLVDSNDRELTLFRPETGKKTIPFDAVTKFEWSSGRRNKAGTFAKRGAIAVGGLFAILGAADPYGDARAASALYAGASGAAIGALFGSLIGLAVKTYDWKEVPLPRVAVVPMIVPGSSIGFAVALRW